MAATAQSAKRKQNDCFSCDQSLRAPSSIQRLMMAIWPSDRYGPRVRHAIADDVGPAFELVEQVAVVRIAGRHARQPGFWRDATPTSES